MAARPPSVPAGSSAKSAAEAVAQKPVKFWDVRDPRKLSERHRRTYNAPASRMFFNVSGAARRVSGDNNAAQRSYASPADMPRWIDDVDVMRCCSAVPSYSTPGAARVAAPV